MTRRLLAVGAAAEAATGLVVMAVPAVFARWLLGADLSGVGLTVGRLSGFALLALGVACSPDTSPGSSHGAALRALLAYSFLVTVYLFSLGVRGASVGRLLWPAMAAHGVYTLLLARAWLGRSRGHQQPRLRPQTDRAR